MRVYTAGEAMDLPICGAPGWSASTEQWQDFLEGAADASDAAGLAEAERELAYRRSRLAQRHQLD
jgi:hypothetical protein